MSLVSCAPHLSRQGMAFEEVLCTMDFWHKEVEATPWYPFAIRDVHVSSTFGCHQAT